jgi:phosphoribosyl-ATP pyrophosphohydrolase
MRRANGMFTLEMLDEIIGERAAAAVDSSYTAGLIAAGPARCARKFGEEAVETIVAALEGDGASLAAEAADTLYHLLVLLRVSGVPLHAVMDELRRRRAASGLEEKAARPVKADGSGDGVGPDRG